MKYCGKCKVTVKSGTARCPLCQNNLEGEAEAEAYPVLPTLYKQYALFFKLLILATVSAGVISVAINLILPQTGYWSLFAVLGIACFWITLAVVYRRKNNIPHIITNQVMVLSVFSVGWDYLTGWRGWSLDYVIPLTCVGAMVVLAVVAKVMHLPAGDYIAALFVDIAFGIVPIVFYLLGMINVAIPSILCIALSLISLVGLILFEGKSMRLELIKRLHM